MKHSSLRMIHPGKKIPILPMKKNYIQNPFLGFGILWNVFKFYGIDFCFTGTEKGKLRLFLRRIIPFILHVSLAYYVCASFAVCYHNPYVTLFIVPFLLSILVSILLWHTLYQKRIHEKRLLKKFCKIKMLLEECITAEKNRHSLYVNLSIVVAILVLTTSSVYFTLAFTDPESPANLFHGFFIRFPNNTATGPLIRITTSQSLCALQYAFPALTSALCGATYYKYGNLVRDYGLLLKSFGFSADEIANIARVRKMIYDVGHDLDGVLSPVAFLLLCNQVAVMHVTLSMFLSFGARGAEPSWVWEHFPALTVVPLCVVVQVLCAGRVPRKFSDVSLVMKAVQDKFAMADGNSRGEVPRLMLIDEPYPKMTAWGVVELDHGFIFTIFGSLLTYGLLMVNFHSEVSVSRVKDAWEGV